MISYIFLRVVFLKKKSFNTCSGTTINMRMHYEKLRILLLLGYKNQKRMMEIRSDVQDLFSLELTEETANCYINF